MQLLNLDFLSYAVIASLSLQVGRWLLKSSPLLPKLHADQLGLTIT